MEVDRSNILDGYVICETCKSQQCGYGPTVEIVVSELLRNHFGPLCDCPRLKGALKVFRNSWSEQVLERPFDADRGAYHEEREAKAAK